MNYAEAGGPAFPRGEIQTAPGMTLRDYFAAKAMHHWLSLPIDDDQRQKLGAEAYKVADAMLKARGK
jgi:hypothetical protein